MSDINNIAGSVSSRVGGYESARVSEARVVSDSSGGSSRSSTPTDRVELSDRGLLLAQLAQTSGVRADVVARVRAEIAAGAYETPERLEKTVDGLLRDVVGSDLI